MSTDLTQALVHQLAEKDTRIAELERKLSAALGAVDFWQTAHEQAEAELAEFKSRHTGAGCGIGVMTGGYCGKKP